MAIGSNHKGFGLYADKIIKKGEKVWEYKPQNEFRLPAKLFAALLKYGYLDGSDVVVDLDQSKFFNHSCSPNVGDSMDDCVAIRDIMPGEELTWDYGSRSLQGFECKCGSPNCRGKIESALPQLYRPWKPNSIVRSTESENSSP